MVVRGRRRDGGGRGLTEVELGVFGLGGGQERVPAEAGLFVRLGDLVEVAVVSGVGDRGFVSCCVVFPGSDGTLHALVVEVGVIFFFEGGEELLELFEAVFSCLTLFSYPDQAGS